MSRVADACPDLVTHGARDNLSDVFRLDVSRSNG